MEHSIALSQTKTVSNSKVKRLLIKSIPWIAAIGVSALFIYASISKLMIYDTFVQQLALTPFKGFENFLAWFVPGIELLIPLLFLFKRTRLTAFYSAFFLMLLFTAYAYVLPHFFARQSCTCGGIISKLDWQGHFYLNLSFTLLTAAGLIAYTYNNQKTKTT